MKPSDRDETAPDPQPQPADPPPADRPFGGLPMYQRRGNSPIDLLEDRVCFLPEQTCHGCRHLGPPVYVRTSRGDRRVRRQCSHARTGYTAPDWPRCAAYEKLSAARPPISRGTETPEPVPGIDAPGEPLT